MRRGALCVYLSLARSVFVCSWCFCQGGCERVYCWDKSFLLQSICVCVCDARVCADYLCNSHVCVCVCAMRVLSGWLVGRVFGVVWKCDRRMRLLNIHSAGWASGTGRQNAVCVCACVCENRLLRLYNINNIVNIYALREHINGAERAACARTPLRTFVCHVLDDGLSLCDRWTSLCFEH